MNFWVAIVIIYFLIGLICPIYWFKFNHNDEAEKGIAEIILLFATFLWLPILVYKVIKKIIHIIKKHRSSSDG